jgi:DNA-binding LacI/PurR family transcriptional regulator
MADVAARAGVSKASVSRALNQPELVGDDVRRRVARAMTDLNYQVNRHARALNGSPTKTVGLLLFEDLSSIVLNPFWGVATSAVYNQLVDSGLDCNLIAIRDGWLESERFPTPDAYRQFLRTRNVDGFLVVGLLLPEFEMYLGDSGIPTVVWGTPSRHSDDITYVDVNHKLGAVSAVDHLFARGCQRVATITGDSSASMAARLRYDGYLEALVTRGQRTDLRLVAHGDFKREAGSRAMKELLSRAPDVDGVFAANDEMALGAIDAILDANLRVPQDIAVVGFDNAAVLTPRTLKLTSIEQPFEAISATLVTALHDRMRGARAKSAVLPAELVLGDTA